MRQMHSNQHMAWHVACTSVMLGQSLDEDIGSQGGGATGGFGARKYKAAWAQATVHVIGLSGDGPGLCDIDSQGSGLYLPPCARMGRKSTARGLFR